MLGQIKGAVGNIIACAVGGGAAPWVDAHVFFHSKGLAPQSPAESLDSHVCKFMGMSEKLRQAVRIQCRWRADTPADAKKGRVLAGKPKTLDALRWRPQALLKEGKAQHPKHESVYPGVGS